MRRVPFLLVSLLFVAVRASGQTAEQSDGTCDSGDPFVCAVTDSDSGHASAWRRAAPAAGAGVAAAWLALSMPGVFASHAASVEPWSPEARGSDLNGSTAVTGNPELRTGGPIGGSGGAPGRGSPSTPTSPPTLGAPAAPAADPPAAVAAVTPEPASLALLATGLAGLMVVGLRRRRPIRPD